RSAARPLTCRRRFSGGLGGKPRPLLRRIVAPSEKRIRTLIQSLDAEKLDEIIGGWLRALADAGRLDGLLLRDTAWAEDANTGYAGNGPQVMATFRNIAVSLLYLAGVTEITRTLQAITRDRNRILSYAYLPL
ncbi:MAG: hypothetical protein ACRDN0_28190, partial [Trebonia sp.]